MLKRSLLALALLASMATAAAAQPTVFLVRHAERADTGRGGMASDPGLSAAGHARARRLAAMLHDVKLTAVFVTEFKRTQETAGPTAGAKHLEVTTVPAADTATLLTKVRAASGSVLIVGHSNTVPEILSGLGAATVVEIPDTEFDNLFIVPPGATEAIRLRY